MLHTNNANLHFDATEKQQVFAALVTLRNILAPKLTLLDTEERVRYGSVNEENKKIINKVKDYYEFEPQLSAPEVNWQEFILDYEDRTFLEFALLSLQSLAYDTESTKMIHDYSNMQAARIDYAYAKYRADCEITGAAQKVKELYQFFIKNNPHNNKDNTKNKTNKTSETDDKVTE
jgi:hypothetical protein